MTSALTDDGPRTQRSLPTNVILESHALGGIRSSRQRHLPNLVGLLAERRISGPWHLRERNLNSVGVYRASGGFFDIFDDGNDIMTNSVYRRQRSLDYALFEREIYALSRDDIKSHINIIQINAWGFDYPSYDNLDFRPFMTIEKAIGSLKSFLEKKCPSTAIKHQLCLDVAEGIRHVHSCDIVHGDLKPDNILVVESDSPSVPFIAKLADFGAFIDLRRTDATSISYSSYTGTQGWKPPEVFEVTTERSSLVPQQLLFKSDCYAYGLLVASVFFKNGQRPYVPKSIEDWTNGASIHQPLAKLLHIQVSQCLSKEPESRPAMSPELLYDCSETYRDWASGKKLLERGTDPSNPALRSWLEFWKNMDGPFFNQLCSEYDVDSTNFSGASLFGLAKTSASVARNDYQRETLKFMRAAAQSSCLAAKGLLSQISRACGSVSNFSLADGLNQENRWLVEAAASGSFTALWQLHEVAPSLEQQAWEHFRKRGGFSGSISPIGISPRSSAVRDNTAITQLHQAAIYGNSVDIYTLANSFIINEVDADGQTALYKAAAAGNFQTLKSLVELNADASITTAVARISCLHWLFMFDSDSTEDVLQLLLSRSANLSPRTNIKIEGNHWQHILFEHFPFHWPIGSPFHWACFTKSFPAMRALLEAGVNVDELDAESDYAAQTPLGMAMYWGAAEVVSFLLQHGANPNRIDGTGRSPLHMIALSSFQNRLFGLPKCLYWWCNHGGQDVHLEMVSQCVKLVVAAGGNINFRRGTNQKGNTPLLDAIDSKDGGVTLALLKAGADVSLYNELEMLPIHCWASLDGRILMYPGTWEPVFHLLVDISPRTHGTDYLGEGVFHHAVSNPSFEHFKRAMEILLASSLRKYVTHKNNHGTSLSKTVLNRKITGGRDIELRFAFLLDCNGAVDLNKEDIGDLIWTTCRNDTLGDQACLRIMKRLVDCKEEMNRDFLTKNLYGNEPGILARDKGTSILMVAVLNAQLETVKYLLQPGVDLQILSINDLTVLDYALHQGEALRRTGLQRWSTHAPAGEPPRHRGHSTNRDPKNFRELFWAGEILSSETVGGETSIYNREKYFKIMDIAEIILDRGGECRSPTGEDSRILRPRQFDAEIAEIEDWGHLYIPEDQPYYEMWKLLYKFDM